MSAATPKEGQTYGLLRILLQGEGAIVFVAALIAYGTSGANLWVFFILLLAPDLFMLGYLAGPRLGALVYNIGHTYLAPVLVLSPFWFAGSPSALPFALIWVAHIGMDRAVGYGLKYPDGFKRTHLMSR